MVVRVFSLWTFLLLIAGCCRAADTIAVLPFFNLDEGNAPNLDWIGESVAENIHESLSSGGLLVLAREDREEVYRRLSVRTGVVLTTASVIKIGETLDAGEAVYGDYKVEAPQAGTGQAGAPGLKSKIRVSVHVIDLRKFRQASSFEQSGPLENLSQMEMELSWMVLKQFAPNSAPSQSAFMQGRPAIRVDAMESYVRGLVSNNAEQRSKLFAQAARLDEHFSQPNFQLGRMLFGKKDYKAAAPWLLKVTKTDSHFLEAAFLLGICRYHEGDFDGAILQLRMVAAEIPLSEVFNDLGAALSRKNDPAAVDNFRKALDGDQGDPDYWFNVGYSLWKRGDFEEAANRFRAVLDRSREDQKATIMLGRCLQKEGPRPGDPRSDGRERIKTVFEDSAFRQLQAELRPK